MCGPYNLASVGVTLDGERCMPGRMLRLPFAVLTCGFGLLGCAMILMRGPSAAVLWVAMKCADRV